jgi:predicted ribosome quality control (RQC) complex YloA/Tae2 family protein
VNDQLIERIIPELSKGLVGLSLREIIQLQANQFAIAFDGDEFRLLFISIEPKEPRLYLIKRRLRELKKDKQNPSKFVVDAAHALVGMISTDVLKYAGERIVEFRFESGKTIFLIAQLTGKSSNLFLLDADRTIIAAAKKPGKDEQSLGKIYSAPTRAAEQRQTDVPDNFAVIATHSTLSESLDAYFDQKEEQETFNVWASAAKKKNQNTKTKLRKLIKNLEDDISQHGDPEHWKEYGDLLLANQSTGKRANGSIIVRDLFDEAAPLITIDVDDNDSIAEAAQKYFRKYAKAKGAADEIGHRIEIVRAQVAIADGEGVKIENAITARDVEFLRNYIGSKKTPASKTKPDLARRLPAGIRSFRSSDGFEILVGKKAADNDRLTFRIANSRDTWMHAADYPGSHVVIRNPDRKEVPQRTLLESAQLAAFFSQGKKQTKAAVNYTEKKFVNKPKNAAPGLVRLASFKTILVEPIFPNVSQT